MVRSASCRSCCHRQWSRSPTSARPYSAMRSGARRGCTPAHLRCRVATRRLAGRLPVRLEAYRRLAEDEVHGVAEEAPGDVGGPLIRQRCQMEYLKEYLEAEMQGRRLPDSGFEWSGHDARRLQEVYG